MSGQTPPQQALALDHPAATAESDHALALLSGTAVAVGHGHDLDALLADIAAGVRRSLDADRVSVLLLDAADRLTPAVAVARQHDENLWQRFRQMPPIALADLDGANDALALGRALVIDDARSSPLVPGAWQQAFQLQRLAIAPVFVSEAPAGILVVELPASVIPVSLSRISLLEGMAALTGVALNGLRRNDALRRVERLNVSVEAITCARSARAIAEHTLDALLETCGLAHGLIALLADDSAEVVAVRGNGLPEPGPYPLTSVPASVLDTCRAAWVDGVREPVEVALGDRIVTALPVSNLGRINAIAVLPTLLASLAPAATAEVGVIATVAGAALRTSYLAGERHWRQRAIDIDNSSDMQPATTHIVSLVRGFLADAGVPLTEVAVDRTTARCTGLPIATGATARLLTKLRRGPVAAGPVRLGAELVVPIATNGRVVGVMRVVELSTECSRIESAGRLISSALARDLDRHRSAELERISAESEAQAAAAGQCYRDAAKALGILADQLRGPQLPDARRLAAAQVLLERTRRLVREAAHSLDPPAQATQLRPAIVELAERVFARGGPELAVRQTGRPVVLDASVRAAVLRGVRRILLLLREASVPVATAHVDWADAVVTVTVRAEALSVLVGSFDDTALHAALRDARAWLGPVGAEVELAAESGGSAYEITAPIGLHRSERSVPVHPVKESGEVMPLQSARSQSA